MTNEKKKKKRFGPEFALGRKRANKRSNLHFGRRKTPKNVKFQKYSKVCPDFARTFGEQGARFPEPLGKLRGYLRASFREPSGGVKNILWPIFVKNFILWPLCGRFASKMSFFFGGGGTCGKFFDFFDFGKFFGFLGEFPCGRCLHRHVCAFVWQQRSMCGENEAKIEQKRKIILHV